MIEVWGVIIIFLSVVNLLRMSVFFILGDIFDIRMRTKKFTNRYLPYEPKVDILVAAYNEEKVIERCLDSIYQSSYQNFRVIVVNDGSIDRTAKVVKKYKREHHLYNLILLTRPNGGKAVALNFALRHVVKSPLVMTLDADSVIAPRALSRAIWYFNDPHLVALAANVMIIPTSTLLGLIQYIEYLMGYRLKKAYTVLNNEYIIGGIGAVFRKRAIKKVEYYDTNTITEDIDLTLKILRLGNKFHKVMYGANVICYTESVSSLKSLFRQRFRWKYGRFQTLWKNRKMFFNTNGVSNKRLTFFQLPFVLYSEFTFLFDPLFISYLIYVCVTYQDVSSLTGMFLFLMFYTAMVIVTDEYTPAVYKLQLLLISPLSYIFFFVISILEYGALWKCMKDVRGILKVEEIGQCQWEHVERAG